ncbi:MAG TPA: hypothetical protein VNK95_22905, partial [Caldilineaceae bacterium]|nr:hypothetical protein [Caldilineaceae bacterium]
LALTVAVVLAPLGVVMALFTGRFIVGYMGLADVLISASAQSDPALMNEVVTDVAGYFVLIGLVMLLHILATSLTNLAVTFHIHTFLHGGALRVGEALRLAWRRFLPAIGMSLVQAVAIGGTTLAAVVAVVIAFAVVALLFGVGAALGEGSSAGAIFMIGAIFVVLAGYLAAILLALAPMAYLGARWAVATPGLALEAFGPLAALGRSWALTRRRFFHTFGFVALLTILNLLVISLPLSVMQQIVLLIVPGQAPLVISLSAGVSYLINLLWQPLYATGMVLLYYDLRVRAESYDLALRVEQMEAEQLEAERAKAAGV